MAKSTTAPAVTVTEPEVYEQIQFGYVQTSNIVEGAELNAANLGTLSLIGTAIDSATYTYNQLCASFYMNNYFQSNYGENPSINIRQADYLNNQHLATYSELWKINFKLMDLYRSFYAALDDSITVRVYNHEPIVVTTPSNSAYIVIHPSIQTDIAQGVDEYGAYYEAKLGGLENPSAVVGGQYLGLRRLGGMGRRGRGMNLLR